MSDEVTLSRADLLAAAEEALRRAESDVEALLSVIFPAWRGWIFTRPANGQPCRIDVYQANDSIEAAAILHRAGFVVVTLHHHQASRYMPCDCRVRVRRPTMRTPPPGQ